MFRISEDSESLLCKIAAADGYKSIYLEQFKHPRI